MAPKRDVWTKKFVEVHERLTWVILSKALDKSPSSIASAAAYAKLGSGRSLEGHWKVVAGFIWIPCARVELGWPHLALQGLPVWGKSPGALDTVVGQYPVPHFLESAGWL